MSLVSCGWSPPSLPSRIVFLHLLGIYTSDLSCETKRIFQLMHYQSVLEDRTVEDIRTQLFQGNNIHELCFHDNSLGNF